MFTWWEQQQLYVVVVYGTIAARLQVSLCSNTTPCRWRWVVSFMLRPLYWRRALAVVSSGGWLVCTPWRENNSLSLPEMESQPSSPYPLKFTELMLMVLRHNRWFGWSTILQIWTLVFWVVTPCEFVGRYQSFAVLFRLQLREWVSEDGDCMFLRNVGIFMSTRRYKPEDQHRYLHRREIFTSHTDL
jgi:hypothetical protein